MWRDNVIIEDKKCEQVIANNGLLDDYVLCYSFKSDTWHTIAFKKVIVIKRFLK